jgi:hypothetical protein
MVNRSRSFNTLLSLKRVKDSISFPDHVERFANSTDRG